MANLLVSFCNVFPPGLALGAYDFDQCRFSWVDLSGIGAEVSGVTGLTLHQGAFWCLAQLPPSGTTVLVKMDKNLRQARNWKLNETRDAHSFIPFGNGFLVNDTAQNRVIWIELAEDGKTLREVEYWRYCDEQTDAVHVNSLAEMNGEVFVSMFGLRPESGWRFARAGMIVNVTTNQVIVDGIFHPHSLTNVGETLYWLESNGGRIHRFSDRGGHEVVGELEGYLRGMTFDGEHLYIGASAARRRSKSTGTNNSLGSLTYDETNSWIYRTKLGSQDCQVEKRMLTAYGAEVYDLLLVKGESVKVEKDEIDPVVQRVWRVEDRYIEATLALDRLSEKIQELEFLQAHLAELRDGQDRARAQLRQQELQLQDQTRQIEQLHRELDTVSRHLEALRRTRTVRVSSALGALGRCMFGRISRPVDS